MSRFADTIREMEDRIIRSMGIPAAVLNGDSTYASSRLSTPKLPPISPHPLAEMPFTVSPYNCERVFDRWKRWPKSKRKRIRMKWRKKFGCVMKCVSDKVYQIGNRFIMCPHMAEKLKAATERGGR